MIPSNSNHCTSCGTQLERGSDNLADGLCPRCLLASFLEPPISGPAPASPAPCVEEVAEAFADLEILGLIGRGGMGAVYKARQKSLDRLVALKLLPQSIAADPEFSRRFEAEAKALAKLNHSNIVTVHEFGQRGGFYFLMMEFVDGPNLRDLLQDHRISPEEALTIVPSLCEALEFAHQRKVVHCDIKPENLLMSTDGKVKIADFGIARILGEANSDTEKSAGTPAYMAPEQKDSAYAIDPRADIYSLGVVIYEMLTGERPSSELVPPSSKNRALDVQLDQIVLRALETNPNLRWPSANALNSELQTFLVERLGEPKVDPPKKPPYSRPWMARLGAAFAMTAPVLFLILSFASGHRQLLPEEAQQELIEAYAESELEIHNLRQQSRAIQNLKSRTAAQEKKSRELENEAFEMIINSPLDLNSPGLTRPRITIGQHVELSLFVVVPMALIGLLLGFRHFSWLRGQKEPLPGLKAAMVATVFGPVLLALLALLPIIYGRIPIYDLIEACSMMVFCLAVVCFLGALTLRQLLAWSRNLRRAPAFHPAHQLATLLIAVGIATPLTLGILAHRSGRNETWEANKIASEESYKIIHGPKGGNPASIREAATAKLKATQQSALSFANRPFYLAFPQGIQRDMVFGVPLLALVAAWQLFTKFQPRRR